jgi:hypothetical protein
MHIHDIAVIPTSAQVLRADDVPLFAIAEPSARDGGLAARTALAVISENLPRIRELVATAARDRASGARLALGHALEETLHMADAEIWLVARKEGAPHVGTAVAIAVIAGVGLHVAYAGDVHAAVVRRDALVSVTRPAGGPRQRARLGSGYQIETDVAELPLAKGDVLVLATDGLRRHVTPDAFLEAGRAENLEQGARVLAYDGEGQGGALLARLALSRSQAETEKIVRALRGLFLFADLTDPERLVVAPYLEERAWPAGATLIREGEQGDSLLVLVDGQVNVSRGSAAVRELGPGDHLGELALAGFASRTATATALTDTRCLALTKARFEDLVRRRPEIGARLTMTMLQVVGERLRDVTDRLAGLR